jgi:sarcosine oxidase subunit alpha
MGWLLSKEKDFIGKRSLARSDCMRDDRKQFVGLVATDGKTVVREGAQLVTSSPAQRPASPCGHITSSYYSAILDRPIALGLIRSGHSRAGETVVAVDSSGVETLLRIERPLFYDPKSERQNA